MPFYYFPMNSYYMFGYLLVIIGSLIMIYGQIKVNSAYKRYERIPNSRGITGAMVAREILDRNGLSDIQIHVVNGKLSDHYNPRNKTINLSREIHDGTSIAALAVASHECGHAIQHLVGYKPLVFRNAILPLCNVGQYLGWIAVFIGLIDLVSLSTGEMKKRYGFVYVDKNDDGSGTYNRYKKKSFDWMKEVIATNGEKI